MVSDSDSSGVLVISPQPFFADRGTPIAVRYVLEALDVLGMRTDLLTLPLGRDVAVAGNTVLRVGNPFKVGSIPIGFSLHKLIFDILLGARTLRLLRKRRYRCIHAVEEAVFLALIARGRLAVPVIYDMQSSLPEHLARHWLFRSRAVQALLVRAERWAVRRVDIVVCSAGLGDHVRRLAPAANVVEWRFPGTSRPAPADQVLALRQELAIAPGTRVVFYSGNFAFYQGVGLLFEAMPAVLDECDDIVFVCVGAADAEEQERGYRAIGDAYRSRVRLVLRQPRERIGVFVTLAEVLVSPRATLGNFPLKVFDYLASGKPIVATDVAAHRCVIDSRLALLVEPTGDALAKGIITVLNDSALAASLVNSARAFADNMLTWASFVDLIQTVYEGATSERIRHQSAWSRIEET